MTEPVYFVYIRGGRRPHAQKWYGIMAIDEEAKLKTALQRHQLDRSEYHLTLDELRAKYPYVPSKDQT